jgi:hypothetical protein
MSGFEALVKETKVWSNEVLNERLSMYAMQILSLNS